MRLRKSLESFMVQLLYLCLCSLLMILIIDVIYYVELFLVIVQQLLLFLYWKSYLAVLEEYLWQFLVVYYIVGITNRSKLSVWDFLGVGLVAFKIDNIEIFLVFDGLLLNNLTFTK